MDKQEKELREFITHVDLSVSSMLDGFQVNEDYNDKYNLHINLNGKTLELGFHSELYQSLMMLLNTELQDFEPIKEND